MIGADRKQRVMEQLADIEAQVRELQRMVDAGEPGLAILAAIQASVKALERSAHAVAEWHFDEQDADISSNVLREELATLFQLLAQARTDSVSLAYRLPRVHPTSHLSVPCASPAGCPSLTSDYASRNALSA